MTTYWPAATDPRVVRAIDTVGKLRRLLDDAPLAPGTDPDVLQEWLTKLTRVIQQLRDLVNWTRQLTPYTAGDDLSVAAAHLQNVVYALVRAAGHQRSFREGNS